MENSQYKQLILTLSVTLRVWWRLSLSSFLLSHHLHSIVVPQGLCFGDLYFFPKKEKKAPNPVEGELATGWIFQRETRGKEWSSLSVAATVRDARPACTEMRAYVGVCFWRLRPWLIRTKLCLSWQELMEESGEQGTEVPLQSPAHNG